VGRWRDNFRCWGVGLVGWEEAGEEPWEDFSMYSVNVLRRSSWVVWRSRVSARPLASFVTASCNEFNCQYKSLEKKWGRGGGDVLVS
jgi:hypothetical protein